VRECKHRFLTTDEKMFVDNLGYETPLGNSNHVCLMCTHVVEVEGHCDGAMVQTGIIPGLT